MQFWGKIGIGVQCMLACGRPPLAPTIDPRGGGAAGSGGNWGTRWGERGGGTRWGAEQGGEGEPSASLPTLAYHPCPLSCPQCISTDFRPYNSFALFLWMFAQMLIHQQHKTSGKIFRRTFLGLLFNVSQSRISPPLVFAKTILSLKLDQTKDNQPLLGIPARRAISKRVAEVHFQNLIPRQGPHTTFNSHEIFMTCPICLQYIDTRDTFISDWKVVGTPIQVWVKWWRNMKCKECDIFSSGKM